MVSTTQTPSTTQATIQTVGTALLALVALANFFRDPDAMVPTLLLALAVAVGAMHCWHLLTQRRFARRTAEQLERLEGKVADLRANSLPKSVYWLWPALAEQGWDFRLVADTLTFVHEATGTTVHTVVSSLDAPHMGRLAYSRLVADLERAGFRPPHSEPLQALRLTASR